MAAKTHNLPSTTAEYNARLDDFLRTYANMSLRRWKLFKTVLLSLAVLIFGGYAIESGGDPTTVAYAALGVAALIAGVEVGELAAVFGDYVPGDFSEDDNSD